MAAFLIVISQALTFCFLYFGMGGSLVSCLIGTIAGLIVSLFLFARD